MFTGNRFAVAAVALSLQLSYVGTASAFVMWSNSNGTATNFDWSNGGSDNGLFGDPVLIGGNTFAFTPAGFRAESINGVSASVTDRMQVELAAHPDWEFTEIRISEAGDYGILNNGSVSAGGSLTATDLVQVRSQSNPLIVTPGGAINSGSGEWSAVSTIVLDDTQGPWTHFTLELQNDLLAISAPGHQSFIQKKVVGGELKVEFIPEPGALALMTIGALAFVGWRRRQVK